MSASINSDCNNLHSGDGDFLRRCQRQSATLGAACGYNVFTFTEYNTDSEGKMAIGGNFAPSNGSSFTIAGYAQVRWRRVFMIRTQAVFVYQPQMAGPSTGKP